MPCLIVFEFPSDGPFGDDAARAYAELAADIAAEEGLVWKLWTEDADERLAGGAYLFADRASAERYVAEHTERLAGFGIRDVTARRYDVNAPLSKVTHGPLERG